jgi:cold shock CspA family protein
MAKSKETYSKKEREKQRQKQKMDKLEKKQERRSSGQANKSFDDMLAYVDENGNLSSSPPSGVKAETLDPEFLYTGIPVREPEEAEKQGRVDFFNEEKGFGFIIETKTKQRIFVHVSQINEPLREGDLVSFQTERGPKGLTAVQVTKIKQ